MKIGFYPRLAKDGIRKNRRMYLPYILTCIGMVMMYYIILFLSHYEALAQLRGAEILQSILGLGAWVIAIFSCIFLFYTNSFLIRRRKKEFGLYNILGMGKRNIGRILFWETVIVALLSLAAGLFIGIAFSKLFEVGLMNLLQGSVDYTLSVSPTAILQTAAVFGVIFLLLLLNSIRQVRFANAVTLLRSESAGEKPPKGNWILGILGFLCLAVAYYLAITIEDPLKALTVFFFAVILVIVGTYLVMIAGTVLLCRILQKKKTYYYKPNHFVSVSSMVYRMKRNGAGLASICILATMVLVMISASSCLYFGAEDSVRTRYPRDINMDIRFAEVADLSDENIGSLADDISAVAAEHGVTPENGYAYRCIYVSGLLTGTAVETDVTKVDAIDAISGLWQFYFVPLSAYNAMMGQNETLGEGEALIYCNRSDYHEDTISFNGGNTFRIKKEVAEFFTNREAAMSIVSSMAIIVPDLSEAVRGLDTLADFTGNRMLTLRYVCNFDTGTDAEQQRTLLYVLRERFGSDAVREQYGIWTVNCENQTIERESFYSLFGGIFYLGVMLSIVFLFGAVLIIYYKQISEGYEDQSRFGIMQKVGMTGREIRSSINSQLLTVFFLPLGFAAMHLAAAFPIIRKLLLLFGLNNVVLFGVTTVISVVVFALFYTLVYRATSTAYYHIVSGAGEGRP